MSQAGRDFETMRDAVMAVLHEHFRPEFLNRVDDVIVFRPLSQDQLAKIVDIQLEGLRRRLADRKLNLEVSDAARQLLAERGWDPVYGARPLKRAIQRLLQDRLAMQLLAGEFSEGDTIKVDVADADLVFRKVIAAEPEPEPAQV